MCVHSLNIWPALLSVSCTLQQHYGCCWKSSSCPRTLTPSCNTVHTAVPPVINEINECPLHGVTSSASSNAVGGRWVGSGHWLARLSPQKVLDSWEQCAGSDALTWLPQASPAPCYCLGGFMAASCGPGRQLSKQSLGLSKKHVDVVLSDMFNGGLRSARLNGTTSERWVAFSFPIPSWRAEHRHGTLQCCGQALGWLCQSQLGLVGEQCAGRCVWLVSVLITSSQRQQLQV